MTLRILVANQSAVRFFDVPNRHALAAAGTQLSLAEWLTDAARLHEREAHKDLGPEFGAHLRERLNTALNGQPPDQLAS